MNIKITEAQEKALKKMLGKLSGLTEKELFGFTVDDTVAMTNLWFILHTETKEDSGKTGDKMRLHSINQDEKTAIIEHMGGLIEVEYYFSEMANLWLTNESCKICDNEGLSPPEVRMMISGYLASAPKHEWVEGMNNVSIEEDISASYALNASPDTSKKQPRYTNEQGFDLIDEWAETYPIETFRVLMWEQMRKYHRRLGKKDTHKSEVAKIADYARRWAEVEDNQ